VAELLVSILILGLISVATVTNLRSSQQADQLATAARIVAADLRAEQDAALTAQSIKTCTNGVSAKIVCEGGTSSCVGACTSLPPFGTGLHFMKASSTYDVFADVDQTKNDWKETDASEIVQTRSLSLVGAPNVIVSDLITSSTQSSIDVAFQRQNGTMGIAGCFIGSCVSPVTLRIILKHTVSNQTAEVDLNSVTGRVSIQ
jgi:type II secretory pathway pseudopilin PulG